MKEYPIIMTGESVQAILKDKKTQTRRVIKPQPPDGYRWLGWITSTTGNDKEIGSACWQNDDIPINHNVKCPYQTGMRLWVKESWRTVKSYDHLSPSKIPMGSAGRWPRVWYSKDWYIDINPKYEERFCGKWRPSRYMPRWASRITLEVTGIRVERLQAITANDAVAEGICETSAWKPAEMNDRPFEEKWWDDFHFWNHYPQLAYSRLWDAINAKRGYPWEINPWVWVVEFKRVENE